jgi:DNA-directed RNA polymerase subunit RPC12/RpoP
MAEYTCAACGGVFEPAWSESEAEAEYQSAFPTEAEVREPREVVCADCYRKMVPPALTPTQWSPEGE